MSAVSDYVAKQKTFNDRMNVAVDGLVTDVDTLNKKITELQNTQGQITPEDQALLDEIQAQGEALATKLETLDQVTPPPAPPVT